MIGTPVTPTTKPGAMLLIARAGQVVHVGAFLGGDGSEQAFGRVTVEMRGSSARFEALERAAFYRGRANGIAGVGR